MSDVHVFPAIERPSARVVGGVRAVAIKALTLTGCTVGEPVSGALQDWMIAHQASRMRHARIGHDCACVFALPDEGGDALTSVRFGGEVEVGKARASVLTGAIIDGAADAVLLAIGAALGQATTWVDDRKRRTGDACVAITVTLGGSPLLAFAVAERGLAMCESGTVDQVDAAWRARLERALESIRVPVRFVIGRPTIDAGRLATLAPGAVISIDRPGTAMLEAGGFRIARAAVGDRQLIIEDMEI